MDQVLAVAAATRDAREANAAMAAEGAFDPSKAKKVTPAMIREAREIKAKKAKDRKFFEVKDKQVYSKSGAPEGRVPLKEIEYYEKLPHTQSFSEPYVFLVAKAKYDKDGNIDIVKVPRKPTHKFDTSRNDRTAMMESNNPRVWDLNKPHDAVTSWLQQNV